MALAQLLGFACPSAAWRPSSRYLVCVQHSNSSVIAPVLLLKHPLSMLLNYLIDTWPFSLNCADSVHIDFCVPVVSACGAVVTTPCLLHVCLQGSHGNIFMTLSCSSLCIVGHHDSLIYDQHLLTLVCITATSAFFTALSCYFSV